MTPANLTRNPLAGTIICVDGPTASGKGTLAKTLARHWRLKFLDTGTLYRAVAYTMVANGADATNPTVATQAALALTQPGVFDFKHKGNNAFGVYIHGTEVTEAIRTLEVGVAASCVAIMPPVRQALLTLQQNFAQHWQPLVGVVLDGRDTGARIAPQAQVKLFLTADVAERGRRRWLEASAAGQTISCADVIAQVAARDARDAHNTICCPEATVIDATHLTATQTLETAIAAVCTTLGRQVPAAPAVE